MPRKDPITGCTVMTLGDFWSSEAKHEGKGRSAGELAEEFHDEMEADRKACEDRYRDPEYALKVLKSAVERWNSYEPDATPLPVPVEVIEVIEVELGQGFRESILHLRARARYAGDETLVEDIIELNDSHTSGSFYEPPDGDMNVEWENLDADGNPVEWRHLYTVVRDFGPKAHPSLRKMSAASTEARRRKVDYLLTVLRRGGLKARIHEDGGTVELQYSAAEKDRVYEVMGRHLLNIDPYDGFWRGNLATRGR
jgi:hypothetical protein